VKIHSVCVTSRAIVESGTQEACLSVGKEPAQMHVQKGVNERLWVHSERKRLPKRLQLRNKMAAQQVPAGKVYVSASFNNTIVTVTDEKGAVLSWSSAGNMGFKGTRKATPFAATSAVEKVLKKVKEENGMKEVEVFIKGPGPGRDSSLRAIKAVGIKISSIADVTPMPHDGPRPRKKRRA
jgi:small subunit ribosomal protein S11